MRFLYGVNPVIEALRAHPGDIKRVLIERGRILAQGATADMRDDPRIAEAYLGAHAQ